MGGGSSNLGKNSSSILGLPYSCLTSYLLRLISFSLLPTPIDVLIIPDVPSLLPPFIFPCRAPFPVPTTIARAFVHELDLSTREPIAPFLKLVLRRASADSVSDLDEVFRVLPLVRLVVVVVVVCC